MKFTEKELMDLKESIEEAKTRVSELNGEKKALIEQLGEYGCKTFDEGVKKLSTFQKELTKIEDNLAKGMEDLTSKYNFE